MKSKIVKISLLFVVFSLSIYIAYGFGAKNYHVRYAKAYYEPTQKLFHHFQKLIEGQKTEALVNEISKINLQLNEIHWRDEMAYSNIVDKTVAVPEAKD